MSNSKTAGVRVKMLREKQGWSQAELAQHAGISRAAVSAIEIGRLVPSVSAALGLARALACSAEDLFGESRQDRCIRWAWAPAKSPYRYWQSEVHGQTIVYPEHGAPIGGATHDGISRDGELTPTTGMDNDPARTLVIAGCDPASGLLAAEYLRVTGHRLLVLPRSSRSALALLADGVVHAAGVHFETASNPMGNVEAARSSLGTNCRLLRIANWEEGLALGTGIKATSLTGALRSGRRWVGRETGSAARHCQDELLGNRTSPRRIARDHWGVAEAVRAGWAEMGVCHRLTAEQSGVRFMTVRMEGYDLCFKARDERDPRILALVRLVRSSSYRRLLGELPGFESTCTGELQSVV